VWCIHRGLQAKLNERDRKVSQVSKEKASGVVESRLCDTERMALQPRERPVSAAPRINSTDLTVLARIKTPAAAPPGRRKDQPIPLF